MRGTFGGAEISLAMLLVAGMLGWYLLLDPVIGLALAVLVTPLLGAAEVVARQPVTTVDLSRDYLDFDKGSDRAMF